ncbi:hypothetical protein BR93DRAFT_668434 [Coniochaeta sp. PMI_546]|nr:hypothetical protein BR93DRAFT_668434 [Coniochaeta sp. PMI_546]
MRPIVTALMPCHAMPCHARHTDVAHLYVCNMRCFLLSLTKATRTLRNGWLRWTDPGPQESQQHRPKSGRPHSAPLLQVSGEPLPHIPRHRCSRSAAARSFSRPTNAQLRNASLCANANSSRQVIRL